MYSGKPPSPGGPPQSNGLRLFVSGPDGDGSRLDGVNPNITVRELAKEFIESRYGPIRRGRPVIALVDGNGHGRALAPFQTLKQNGVTDGDKLVINVYTNAAGPFELVATFMAGAAVSGVVGNTAYDLLKQVLGRLRKRFGSAKDAGLSEQDVADIAVGCCCSWLKIEDPAKVVVYDVWVDADSFCVYPRLVPDRNVGHAILDTPMGPVSAIIIAAADGDPDSLQIEIKSDLPLEVRKKYGWLFRDPSEHD